MQKNFKKNNKKAMPTVRQGFSLIEVLLVIFILSISLVVFVQVISQSINHSLESRDTIIAAGLAQEGVELVKNKRDNNWAQKRPALDGIPDGSCVVSYNTTNVSSSWPVVLKIDGAGYYTSAWGPPSKFARRINIGNDGVNKKVTSTVVWERTDFPDVDFCNAANRCIYAQITLTKWGE